MEDAHRLEKEAFVTNGLGCGVLTVLLCLGHLPLLFAIRMLLLGNRKFGASPMLDVFVLGLPSALIVTIGSEYYLASLSFTCCLLLLRLGCAPPASSSKSQADRSFRTDITLFKGINVLLTCICILAVDFRIFPRSFGKTEAYGISLMDVGVSSFVISSAVTSKFARRRATTSISNRKSCQSALMFILSESLPPQRRFVLLLGVGRLIMLKVLNYQEHVSEYGVHWNFFVTLFCVWTIADILHLTLPRSFMAPLGVGLLILYQCLLSTSTGLTHYVLSDYRVGIVAANKEGIVSLLGYVPLFLIAEALSSSIFFPKSRSNSSYNSGNNDIKSAETAAIAATTSLNSSNNGSCERSQVSSTEQENATSSTSALQNQKASHYQLFYTCAFFWIVWVLVENSVQLSSRRLVNASFVVLSLAMFATLLSAIRCVRLVGIRHGFNDWAIRSMENMNKHSLIVFLGSNLLTGSINMSMNTLGVGTEGAVLVVLLYTCAIFTFSEIAEQFLGSRNTDAFTTANTNTVNTRSGTVDSTGTRSSTKLSGGGSTGRSRSSERDGSNITNTTSSTTTTTTVAQNKEVTSVHSHH